MILTAWVFGAFIVYAVSAISTECPPINPVENGSYECSNNFNAGSKCIFRCNVYYFLHGFMEVNCESTNAGKPQWSNNPPTCEPDLLCQPGLVEPKFGRMECSNGNKFNSMCNFFCDEGHFIDGSSSVRCSEIQSDGMVKWNSAGPVCRPCKNCNVDLLIVFQPGDFENMHEWIMHTFGQLSGAMKQGNAKISLMEVEDRNVVGCKTRYHKETYKILLDLDAYSIYDVERLLDDHEDRSNICHSPKHGIRPAVKYMDLFGSQLTKIVIIFTHKDQQRDDIQKELQHAKENGVIIIFAPLKDSVRLKKRLDVASMVSLGVQTYLSQTENNVEENNVFARLFSSNAADRTKSRLFPYHVVVFMIVFIYV